MNYLGKVIGGLKGFYSGINGATLTGAIDVIVVEQEDGSFKCSPFHVRFGKLGVLRSKEKVVDIEVNGSVAPIHMKLGDSGEAFFVQEFGLEDEFDDSNLATSPIPSPRISDADVHPHPCEDCVSDRLTYDHETGDSLEGEERVLPVGSIQIEEPKEMEGTPTSRNEDGKGRKRRRKRRKNQGSKSDIKVELPLPPPLKESGEGSNESGSERNEPIFKMDEDLSNLDGPGPPHFAFDDLASPYPMNRSYHRDFYSDTEVEKENSRPSTPIQSDSEYEISKIQKEGDGAEEVGKWVWGELPSTGNTPATTPGNPPNGRSALRPEDKSEKSDTAEEEAKKASEQKSVLAGMFSFMKSGKKENSGGENEAPGIYLDDLNLENMDPEVAALYFPNFGKENRDSSKKPTTDEEDGESGKGNSLPQSPAPGSSPRSSHMALYMEEQRAQNASPSPYSSFEAISLCGSNLNLFEQSQLSFDDFAENPDILLSAPPESIVVRVDGKLIPWSAALPQLLSSTFFKRPLPSPVYQKLVEQHVKKQDDGGGKDASKKGYSWFPWRRSKGGDGLDDGQSSPEGHGRERSGTNSSDISPRSLARVDLSNPTPKDVVLAMEDDERSSMAVNHPQPIPGAIHVRTDKYKKSLRMTSDQIASLGLRYGQNEAVFSVTTAYQGTSVARCHIYLWRYDDRVVISDIDGTITKSDVLGQILPIIGENWAQSGVAQLFTQIHDNGYKMLYLSARAIGQASITRDYLKSIKQGDITLPDGPLLLNPTSLISALHREVIEKKPEEFKIACLQDVKHLFPQPPFYAGYGNKINDVWAYRAVDIPISRIFTINHKGELRHALTNTFQSSYTSLVELAEHIFPAYKYVVAYSQGMGQMDKYNSFEFWRDPIPLLFEPKSPQEPLPQESIALVKTPSTEVLTVSSPEPSPGLVTSAIFT